MIILLIFILLLICAFICIIFTCFNNGRYSNNGNSCNNINNNARYSIYGGHAREAHKRENHDIWEENVNTAKSLLNDEFKDLYNDNEKQIILHICKQELDCNIWNDLIDFSKENLNEGANLYQNYYVRPFDRIKAYYPESFLTIPCYFRKFFINRLQILTRFYKPNSVILYNGATNSVFLPILIDLFPTYIWHIYEELDLSYELDLKKNTNLYKKKMDLQEANTWNDKVDVFISDFRRPVQSSTISLKKEDTPLQERVNKMMLEDVMFNVELMRAIKPKIGAGIKFKSPHVDPFSSENMEIPRGKILWLPWSSSTSTDGTLVIDGAEIKNKTNMTIYLSIVQNAYAIHNRYYRPWAIYHRPIYHHPMYRKISTDCKSGSLQESCRCFDCTCEYITISNYAKLKLLSSGNGKDISQAQSIGQLISQLNYKLEPIVSIVNKTNYHGRFPELLPAIRIKTIANLQNIGVYAGIDIAQKKEYLQRLKHYADQYDEFSDTNIDTFKHNGHAIEKHPHGAKKYNMDVANSAKTALTVLKKFQYSKEEQKIILHMVSKISKLPTIWNDLKNVMVYRGDKDKLAHNYVYCHLGQRKLFMAELQLLSRFLPDVNNNAVIVYVGAAAGFHLPLLFKLFPNTIWHLYDPAPFCNKLVEMNSFQPQKAKHSRRVYLYNEFFTDDTANLWRNKCDLFISDIRLSANTRSTFEFQVESDMRMQEKWTLIINPKLGASLKFRPPYLDPNIKHFSYKYLRGQIMWQMWPPKNSTECRLIVDAIDIHNNRYEHNRYEHNNSQFDYNAMEFDVVKYQNACAYHNIIERAWVAYELPTFNDHVCQELSNVVGYDRCFDCTCEAISWIQYRELKNAKKQELNKYFDELTHITHQPLLNKKSMHGHNQYDLPSVRLSKV